MKLTVYDYGADGNRIFEYITDQPFDDVSPDNVHIETTNKRGFSIFGSVED